MKITNVLYHPDGMKATMFRIELSIGATLLIEEAIEQKCVVHIVLPKVYQGHNLENELTSGANTPTLGHLRRAGLRSFGKRRDHRIQLTFSLDTDDSLPEQEITAYLVAQSMIFAMQCFVILNIQNIWTS